MAIVNSQLNSRLGLQGRVPEKYNGTSGLVIDKSPGLPGGEEPVLESLYDLEDANPETYLKKLNKELSTRK